MCQCMIGWMLVVLISSVQSHCTNVGQSTIGSPYTLYLTDIKNQDTTGMCWSFSTTSYLESMYYILTKNKYRLSTQQLSDNIVEFFNQNPQYGCESMSQTPRPSFNGIAELMCGLTYISHNGIMTEFDYPFVGGGEKYLYNASYITPIGVRNVRQVCQHLITNEDKMKCLTLNLLNGPILASINSQFDQNGLGVIDSVSPANHAILITDVCLINNQHYVEIQNSWGSLWGQGGYGYIPMTDNGQWINNLQVLNNLIVADVYNRYTNGQSLTIETKGYSDCSTQGQIILNLTVYLTIAITLIMLLMITSTAFVIIRYYRA